MKRKSVFLIFALMAVALPYERELAQSTQTSTPTTVTAASSDCVSTAGTDSAIKKLSANPPKASECFVARDLICVGCRRGAPVNLRPPCYPRLASSAKVSGAVIVEVAVNEKGNVFWAHVEKGHPLLHAAALAAALKQKFTPYTCAGRPIKAFELVLYNFERAD